MAGEARALATWIDRTIFWAAVGMVMGAMGDKLPAAFREDRSAFSGRSFDDDALKAAAPAARDQTYAQLVLAEQMLADGRPFLTGAAPTIADCALYNPVCVSCWSGWVAASRCRRSIFCRGSSPGPVA